MVTCFQLDSASDSQTQVTSLKKPFLFVDSLKKPIKQKGENKKGVTHFSVNEKRAADTEATGVSNRTRKAIPTTK